MYSKFCSITQHYQMEPSLMTGSSCRLHIIHKQRRCFHLHVAYMTDNNPTVHVVHFCILLSAVFTFFAHFHPYQFIYRRYSHWISCDVAITVYYTLSDKPRLSYVWEKCCGLDRETAGPEWQLSRERAVELKGIIELLSQELLIPTL